MSDRLPTVLVTGASTGIGAVYADRFAKRGHDLVLVARDAARLETLAVRLRAETGVAVDVLPADLSAADQLAKVEARLRDDAGIGVLINNAGIAAHGGFTQTNLDAVSQLIDINITAVARLSTVAAQRFAASGGGAIINVSSVLGFIPEWPFGVYGGSKAFVLGLSQALNAELGGQGVYVQAVLPATTRTEIWERSGRDVDKLSDVMEAGDLVDAALVAFDRREQVTLPSLHDGERWAAYEAARLAVASDVSHAEPGERYRAA